MYNIWSFLLQTLSVSIVIMILLIVKSILADKLSPRWQYGIWILLMLRILIPVNLSSYIIPKLPIWMETLKGICEKQLNSNYTFVYQPLELAHTIPILTGKPESITDWLFCIYIGGIIFCLLRYLISYISIRTLLKQGTYGNSEPEARMLTLCEKYHLKPCRILAVNGISSAFLCGVLRPILVVPKDVYVDDKILLHELLHMKYMDTIQNIGWCILRSLHWCNPLVQYAVHHIENDIESLCDQRVLERLEGEERREYGTILLNMANAKYARIPGTSSISNGGKNISRRISAIVRFKQYPQDLSLISVCMILLLLNPTIVGYANTYSRDDYSPSSEKDVEQIMAIARVNRCTTLAGALDTYAKGIMFKNGAYIASASSLDKHRELETIIEQTFKNYDYDNKYLEYDYQDTYIDTGLYTNYVQEFSGYHIYNLKQISDTYYQGYIVFSVRVYTDETGENWSETPSGNTLNDALLIIPVDITYEDAWVVKETGTRSTYTGNYLDMEMDTSSPYIKKYYAEGEYGTVTLTLRTRYSIDNTLSNDYSFLPIASERFDDSPKTNAVFDDYFSTTLTIYDSTPSQRTPPVHLGIETMELESENQTLPDGSFGDGFYSQYFKDSSSFSGSSNAGESWTFEKIDKNWDGIIQDGGGGSSTMDKESGLLALPPAYGARIYWDGGIAEELILKEVIE